MFTEITGLARVEADSLLFEARQAFDTYGVCQKHWIILTRLEAIIERSSALSLRARYGELSACEVAELLPAMKELQGLAGYIIIVHRKYKVPMQGSGRNYGRRMKRLFVALETFKRTHARIVAQSD